mmetsp:Transcript_2750/g.5075  ORF Transcript_2750/g.5075 Transcript_2750/m.5075 type:complete len:573 (-) Transcript_2750:498-2216(-)
MARGRKKIHMTHQQQQQHKHSSSSSSHSSGSSSHMRETSSNSPSITSIHTTNTNTNTNTNIALKAKRSKLRSAVEDQVDRNQQQQQQQRQRQQQQQNEGGRHGRRRKLFEKFERPLSWGIDTVTTLRRDAVLGAMSLVDLKKLPVNLKHLFVPVVAGIVHVSMLLLWTQRWNRDVGHLEFSHRLWLVTPLLFSILYIALSYLGVKVMRIQSVVDEGVREYMIVYYVYQVVFRLHLSFKLLQTANRAGMLWFGNDLLVQEQQQQQGQEVFDVVLLVWMHYYNQYVDLLDTAFVVVRKKASHVTFLHLYKRVLLIWCWFFILKFDCATGDAYLLGSLTGFVSALTYLYNLLGLLGVKGHARWKLKFTELHMGLYVLLIAHSLYCFTLGTQPSVMSILQCAVMSNLLVLLTDFHHRDSDIARSSVKKTNRRVVFSFDSSGWFYVYHFGVARYLQHHILKQIPRDRTAFSGASGGALVGAALCAGFDIDELVEFVISCQAVCEYNPWQMLPCAEKALKMFKKKNLASECSDRLSVLVTRVKCAPPFFMGCFKSATTNIRSPLCPICVNSFCIYINI